MRQWIDLGVNVDHVATLRQARGTPYPDPIQAALVAEQNGADGITIHLREDRRHIQDGDLRRMQESIETRVNLEMAITPEMLDIACAHQPFACCLVPEKREELTTEGGLDVRGQQNSVSQAVGQLREVGIRVSLFIDPEPDQIQAAAECAADVVELHTGDYAESRGAEQAKALDRIRAGAEQAAEAGMLVHAGHGLHYHNTAQVAAIEPISELNIGHAIIARAVIVGLPQAVRDMRSLMNQARGLA